MIITIRYTKLKLLVIGAVLVSSGCLRIGSRPAVPAEAGMYLSVSRGETWEGRQRLVVPAGVSSLTGLSVNKIFSDPEDPRAMYLVTPGNGLIFTYDGGVTWQQPPGVTGGTINDVAVDPRQTCTVYLGIGSSVLKSQDCNRNYREVYVDPRPNAVTAVAVDGVNSQVVYLGTSAGDLVRSSNGGTSWSRVYQFGSSLEWILFDPRHPRRAYALTAAHGLFRTTDGAVTWSSLSSGLAPFSQGQKIRRLLFAYDQPETLLLLNRYGLLRSSDAGDSWTALQLITPPLSTDILTFAINPNNSQEVYYATASTFYSTTDGGANWVTRRLPGRRAVPQVLLIHPRHTGAMYLGLTILPN